MTSKEEFKNKLRAKSDASASTADNLLKEEYDVLMKLKRTDIERLIPNITNRQKYEQLIASVEESSKHNENLAQLQTRLETLGNSGITLAKQLIKLMV